MNLAFLRAVRWRTVAIATVIAAVPITATVVADPAATAALIPTGLPLSAVTTSAGAATGGSHPAAASVPPPCGPLSSAAPIALSDRTSTAETVLRRLAAHLGAAASDGETGRYTRISWQQHAMSTDIGDCVTSTRGAAQETLWRDEQHDSGVTVDVPWHPLTSPAPATETSRYRAGQLTGTIPGTVPADPNKLAAALTAAGASDPGQRVDTIGSLITRHDTPLGARRAILLVLADVPGLLVHAPVTVEHRTGIPVSLTSGGTRHVLILNPVTGQIFAAENVLLDPVIGHNLAVRVPYSESLTAVTDRGRNTRPGPSSKSLLSGAVPVAAYR